MKNHLLLTLILAINLFAPVNSNLFAAEKHTTTTPIFKENPQQIDPGLELQRLRNEGVALYESGIALGDALDRFQRAAALSHQAADTFNIAVVLFKQNKLVETKTWLQQALQQDENFPNAYYLLGVLARADGDFAAAKKFWERTLTLAPDDAYLHYQLALLARAERNMPAFLQSLVNALSLEPDNTAALYQMFGYYQMSGNTELAKETLAKFNMLKRKERFSRRERQKDPSKLALPMLVTHNQHSTDNQKTNFIPSFNITELNPDCTATAAERFTTVIGTKVQEAVAVACNDQRLLHTTLAINGEFMPFGQVPADTRDLRLEWFDTQGPRVLAVTDNGLFLSNNLVGTKGEFLNLLPQAKLPLALADLDSDGDLDIVTGAGQIPLTNANKLRFVQEQSLYQKGPLLKQLSEAKDLTVTDLNRDGLSDVLIVYEKGISVALGTPNGFNQVLELAETTATVHLVAGDFDNNGRLDLALLTPQAVRWLWNLKIQEQSITATATSSMAIAANSGSQFAATDFNNDGLLDLIIVTATGQAAMLVNQGAARFVMTDLGAWPTMSNTGRFIAIDFDHDKREDLAYINTNGKIAVAHNVTAKVGNTIALFANGVRATPSGLLTQIEIRRGNQYAYRQSNGGIQRIGIGDVDYIEILRLEWTNGFVENKLKIDATTTPYLFKESERISGSCPSLFIWDGKKFAYFDDAFISGPMGVPMDRNVYFPVQDRESIVIPSEKVNLRHERQLEIRFTEELHETVFLDQARLFVIDHPANTIVFPHSRLSPIAAPKESFYLARQLVAPARATGSDGSDLTGIIASVDKVSANFFNRAPQSGFSEPHWIELTVPTTIDPAHIDAILATGWFYYFVSTTMIAQAQASGPTLPWPWIEQEINGIWQDITPLGIPTGKTKTAVAPITPGQLKSRHLRIRSGISVYWDRIAFGVNTPNPQPYTQTTAQLTESVVRFHGFSGLTAHNPERFDYHAVHYSSKWNPMSGHYTDYGPADALIVAADGRYAVFGSGDEIALSFTVEQPSPPPGQERSYLLELTGYVKDGDRYTADGWRVEPMPYLGLNQYPAPQDQRLLDAQTRSPYRTRLPLDFSLATLKRNIEDR